MVSSSDENKQESKEDDKSEPKDVFELADELMEPGTIL